MYADRMTRNDFDKLKIYNLIYDHDKTIHFSRTNKMFNKDSSSDDEFMFDIEVAVAKKMSNDISRKTRMGMLANTLFNHGLMGKTGNRIGESTFHHLLKNPFYYGVFKWKDKMYQGNHTPLITKDLFGKVQNILTGNFRPYSNRKNFHFNNMIICGVCGCKVLGEEKRLSKL